MSTITKRFEEPNLYSTISLYPMLPATRLKVNCEDYNCVGKYAALIGVEICAVLATSIGTIETIFWTAIFLLAKTVHVFIPRSFEIPTSICTWLLSRAVSSLMITTTATVYAIFNFFNTDSELNKTLGSVENSIKNRVEACEEIINYQLFDGT